MIRVVLSPSFKGRVPFHALIAPASVIILAGASKG